MNSWLRAHPVAGFIALVSIWSWSIWSLLIPMVGAGGLVRSPPAAALAVAGLGALGPSLAGLLLTVLTQGRSGLRALGHRLSPPPPGSSWWALTLIPLATAAVPALRSAMGLPVDTAGMVARLGPGLALGISAGLMEEFGWRGTLLPLLRARHGPLAAAIGVGVVWGGLWHGVADYFGVPGQGAVFWAHIALLGPGLLIPWSLVLSWVFERTGGNLRMAILMHASISSSALIFSQPYASPTESLMWTTVAVAVAWIVAVGLWALPPGRHAN